MNDSTPYVHGAYAVASALCLNSTRSLPGSRSQEPKISSILFIPTDHRRTDATMS